jgi:hypothetical protein
MHCHMEANTLIRFIKRCYMTCLRDSVYISCHWKLCHYADCYWVLRTKHRHFCINIFIFYEAFNPETSCNNTSSSNKPKRYLLMIVCCCGLEFQFLSVPMYSSPPSRSTLLTFYVPNTLSPLGYKVSNMSVIGYRVCTPVDMWYHI